LQYYFGDKNGDVFVIKIAILFWL